MSTQMAHGERHGKKAANQETQVNVKPGDTARGRMTGRVDTAGGKSTVLTVIASVDDERAFVPGSKVFKTLTSQAGVRSSS